MKELILHHYDFSNFSEKVRLVLGFKNLAWHSVTIPAYAPKPDYTPLTAGYRRTPALQIGADIYCDTRLIIEVIEQLQPQPSLYPGANPARTRALCAALIEWAEHGLFRPLALYITGLHAARFPAEFHADRAQLHGKPRPSVAQVQASARKYQAQVECQLQWIEDLLAETGDSVLPEGLSLADIALYEAPWFLRTIGGEGALPAALPRLTRWAAGVDAIGHGRCSPMAAETALAVAREALPEPCVAPSAAVPEGVVAGDRVSVSPFDQRSPASGELVCIDGHRITLAHEHPRTGRVHVHFPRLGYRVSRQR